ncbi:hypothetical protein AAMO2058_000695200 [Amorphochlora amoebiformis]
MPTKSAHKTDSKVPGRRNSGKVKSAPGSGSKRQSLPIRTKSGGLTSPRGKRSTSRPTTPPTPGKLANRERSVSASVSTTPKSPAPKDKSRPLPTRENLRKRRRVICEIVTTEETYVHSLQILLTDLLLPIERKFKSKLHKSTQLTLVSSAAALEVLVVLHRRLLEDLKQRAASVILQVKRETQAAAAARKRKQRQEQKDRIAARRSTASSRFKNPVKTAKGRPSRAPPKRSSSKKKSAPRLPARSPSTSTSMGSEKKSPKSPKSPKTPKSPRTQDNRFLHDASNTTVGASLSELDNDRLSSDLTFLDEDLETGEVDSQEIIAQQETEGSVIQLYDEYAEHFKMYFRYVQNYPKLAMDLAGENLTSKSLTKYIDQTCKRLRQFGILSLLILPIQRIPRYLLLMESLEKCLPNMHLYLPKLQACLKRLLVVTKAIDECQRQSDNSLKLFTLQSNLRGAPSDFAVLTPSREYVRQETLLFLKAESLGGEIDDTKWSEASKVSMLMFNDVLIIVRNKFDYIKHFELHDITIYEGKRQPVWDLYTGSPELLYGRVMFNSMPHLKKWSAIAFPVIQKAKDSYAIHARAKANQRGTANKSVIDRVNVYLRVRPFVTEAERDLKQSCLTLEGENVAVLHRPGVGAAGPSTRERERVGVYDHCFSDKATQRDIFRRVGEETLGSLFCGYNCAIIAYGNTGSGKTHTITGGAGTRRGLVPRVLEELFRVLKRETWGKSEIEVSYVQIYCNKLYDLQGSAKHTSKSLKIVRRSDKNEVSGVVKTKIASADDAISIIEAGNKKRVTRSHKMNDASSRSHSVFTIHCKLHNSSKNATTKSVLQLVDLAGSENIKETGVEGVALTESMHINKSLTSLGRALHAVLSSEGKTKKAVVSFRETTLTHMLSDVLTGNFVCSLILTVSSSPAHKQAELTSKTMAFGLGAKRLEVKAQAKVANKESKLSHFLSGVWRTVNWL